MHLGDTHVLSEINLRNMENLKIALKNPIRREDEMPGISETMVRGNGDVCSALPLSLSSFEPLKPTQGRKGRKKKNLSVSGICSNWTTATTRLDGGRRKRRKRSQIDISVLDLPNTLNSSPPPKKKL